MLVQGGYNLQPVCYKLQGYNLQPGCYKLQGYKATRLQGSQFCKAVSYKATEAARLHVISILVDFGVGVQTRGTAPVVVEALARESNYLI